ncbi:hypothetical protein ACGF5T_32230 [Streptomyces sp. NPDC047853]|uniref:hypothetical protein n=1 Tax=unclassified Streptomyces TaxID=2593676 RepID=UPI00345222A9
MRIPGTEQAGHHRGHAAHRLRGRANGESTEQIQPALIIPTGKHKGQSPSVVSIYRALAEHEERAAYPEAVEQARADFTAFTGARFVTSRQLRENRAVHVRAERPVIGPGQPMAYGSGQDQPGIREGRATRFTSGTQAPLNAAWPRAPEK